MAALSGHLTMGTPPCALSYGVPIPAVGKYKKNVASSV